MRDEACQPLENRVLFAVTAVQSGRTITITGTDGADNVQVERFGKSQGRINDVNGGNANVLIFDLRSVRTFVFNGNAGNDNLSMGHVPGKLIANGGDGNDSLSASRAGDYADSLSGGNGNDYLYGAGGNDTLDGGEGYDLMIGSTGKDYFYTLSDRSGDDTVDGGAGVDTVDFVQYDRGVRLQIGDTDPIDTRVDDVLLNSIDVVNGTGYNDTIVASTGRDRYIVLGKGNDIFTGGKGNETVLGGRGNDKISTNAGNDTIIDDIGDNTLNGGSGTNTINGVVS